MEWLLKLAESKTAWKFHLSIAAVKYITWIACAFNLYGQLYYPVKLIEYATIEKVYQHLCNGAWFIAIFSYSVIYFTYNIMVFFVELFYEARAKSLRHKKWGTTDIYLKKSPEVHKYMSMSLSEYREERKYNLMEISCAIDIILLGQTPILLKIIGTNLVHISTMIAVAEVLAFCVGAILWRYPTELDSTVHKFILESLKNKAVSKK